MKFGSKFRVGIVLLVIMCCMFVFDAMEVVLANEIEIMAPAKAMVVLEGNSNNILYSYNCDNRLPMASTTKIATAIVAIENCEDLDKKFVVSDNSIGIEGTSIYLKKGESIRTHPFLLVQRMNIKEGVSLDTPSRFIQNCIILNLSHDYLT